MRIDIDSYKEILDTITRNKSRSLLTGFGVFWGVFMLVVLIGGGQGVKELLANNFEGFATNTTMVFVQPTTKAYKGFRKGRSWNAEDRDVARIRERMPELEVVTPMVFGGQATVVYGDRKSSGNIKGLLPEYQKVQAPKIYYGRFINEMDVKASRRVCVLGKKIAKELFGDIDPCGKRVKVGNIYYQIVGVDYNNSGINMGGQAEEAITIPFNVCRQIYNFGKYVHTIAMVGRGDVNMKSLEPRIREIIAREHSVDPTDEHAISLFNTQVMFGIMDSLFKGVNFLIWLIGLGTILAGAIGVSNIMMVTVKERTVEIGIRRAIGATPSDVLSQIILESVLLTVISGMGAIMFSVMLLSLLEMITGGQAVFQISFTTAMLAAMLLTVLGIAAGMAPASRAMAIKPVDAMRDE